MGFYNFLFSLIEEMSVWNKLVSFFSFSSPPNVQMENMVFFLAELGLMNYQISISYSPSTIASAAVYVARCTLEKNPIWTATLHHHTGYVEEELKYINKLPWKFLLFFCLNQQ